MTPIFVNRTTAAALCSISVDTFDNWRRNDVAFPPPAFVREGRPFWKWADLETYLAGGSKRGDNGSNQSPFQKALTHAKGPDRARP